MRKRQSKTTFNIWKWLFWILFGGLIAVFCFVYLEVFTIKPSINTKEDPITKNNNSADFEIVMNKKQFSKVIDRYLADKNPGKLNLKFSLSDNPYLSGEIKFIGQNVPFKMDLSPKVTKEQNLSLNIERISIGNLSLPRGQILRLLQNQESFPNFIKIDYQKSNILINLQKIKYNKQVTLSIKKIDFDADKIIFNSYANK